MQQAWRRKLVLMVKAPAAGRVKTRLARGIGVTGALRFYRATTSALSRRVSSDSRWQTLLAVSPDDAINHTVWPTVLPRRGQGLGDLGQRMQKVMDELPPGPVVIIGSDIPGVTPSLIAEAFRRLGRADVVFGPAPDGGYWLVGFKRCPRIPEIFGNVRWSDPHTLSDTLRNTTQLTTEFIETLDDIDEAGDLARIGDWTGRLILPSTIYRQNCNNTSLPQSADKSGQA